MPVAESLARALLTAGGGAEGRGEEEEEGKGRAPFHSDALPLHRTYWVIRESLLAILGFPMEGLPTTVPPLAPSQHELFVLDRRRLGRLGRRLQLLAKLSAVGLSLRTLGHGQWEETLERMARLVLEGEEEEHLVDPEVSERLAAEAMRGLARDERGAEEERRLTIRAAIQRITLSSPQNGGDPLELLLERRIGSLLRQSLSADNRDEAVRTSKPVSILVRHGIAECLCESLNRALAEIQRVYYLHCQVLAPIYHKFLSDNHRIPQQC